MLLCKPLVIKFLTLGIIMNNTNNVGHELSVSVFNFLEKYNKEVDFNFFEESKKFIKLFTSMVFIKNFDEQVYFDEIKKFFAEILANQMTDKQKIDFLIDEELKKLKNIIG